MDYMVAYAGGPSEWTDIMMGAAFGFVDKGFAGRVGRAVFTPILGIAAYYGGEDLVRALVRATPCEMPGYSRGPRSPESRCAPM